MWQSLLSLRTTVQANVVAPNKFEGGKGGRGDHEIGMQTKDKGADT